MFSACKIVKSGDTSIREVDNINKLQSPSLLKLLLIDYSLEFSNFSRINYQNPDVLFHSQIPQSRIKLFLIEKTRKNNKKLSDLVILGLACLW